jgi:hypothetical protein
LKSSGKLEKKGEIQKIQVLDRLVPNQNYIFFSAQSAEGQKGKSLGQGKWRSFAQRDPAELSLRDALLSTAHQSASSE